MIASKRNIKAGKQFNAYFPNAKGLQDIILKDGDVENTVKLCQKTVRTTLSHTAKLSPLLQAKSRQQTAKNIYDFILTYIQYNYDNREGDIEAIERVRTPARTWADRTEGADCEDYAILISSILTNLGIPHKFRITKYDNKPNWQHIYVVMEDEKRDYSINIDPVVDFQFNYEVPYTAKKDYPMPVRAKSTLSGIAPQPSQFFTQHPTHMKKGIDALEFQMMKSGGLGYIDPSVDSNKGYFAHYAQAKGFNTEQKLYNEMQPKIDWALRNNAKTHGMYKYASITLQDGVDAGENALKQDIIKSRVYIFGTTYVRNNPESPLKLKAVSASPATTIAPVTASFGGGELLSKKNLMIAGGAAAALGLITVLLK